MCPKHMDETALRAEWSGPKHPSGFLFKVEQMNGPGTTER